MSATRMRQIAGFRLASARAMRRLVDEQPKVLAAIDSAARGEIGQVEAEELLGAHLAAREACLSAMRQHDGEWRDLATDAGQWPSADAEEITRTSREVLAVLREIETTDAHFARELTTRRAHARTELSRADTGRAAQRAYGGGTPPSGDPEPRFTDRSA
jgi:hypothetical protein